MLALSLACLQTSTLDKILNDPRLDGAVVSAVVADERGNALFKRNSSLHVTPASNQKLLSASFALYELGLDFRPVTRFWTDARVTTVESNGDPLMTYSDLRSIREKLGHSCATVKVFEAYAPGIPDSWEYDDLPNKYAAQVTAFSFDRGAFEARSVGGKIRLVPESFGVSIDHNAGSKFSWRYDPIKRTLKSVGPIPTKDGVVDTLALPRPDECSAMILGGRFEVATTLPNSRPTLEWVGKPMSEAVAACLPPSDNNIAEHLFLMASNHLGPIVAAPYALSRERMSKFLTRTVGIKGGDVNVYDGSGMSRHNFLTTRALTKLLAWHTTQPWFPTWRSALAKPGSGTLAHRLSGITFAGKTGSLDRVAALSGYLDTVRGEHRIVSIILNNYSCSGSDAREVIDSFVHAVSLTGS